MDTVEKLDIGNELLASQKSDEPVLPESDESTNVGNDEVVEGNDGNVKLLEKCANEQTKEQTQDDEVVEGNDGNIKLLQECANEQTQADGEAQDIVLLEPEQKTTELPEKSLDLENLDPPANSEEIQENVQIDNISDVDMPPSSDLIVKESEVQKEDVQNMEVEVVSSAGNGDDPEPQVGSSEDQQAPSSYAEEMFKKLENSGLGLLSQYDSDDSDASVVETVVPSNYRNQIVEIISDTSSDDDSDVEIVSQVKELNKIIDADGEEDDDDEDGTGKSRKPPRVKGELLLDDLPPIQDLHITVPETECVELGIINSIVDQLVLVKSITGSILLDLETVLFLEKGQKVLGEVFDVLGQVADPIYCVRFNSNKQIKDKGIEIGEKVYVAPKTEHTQFIILSNLISVRGSDASWENDVEPPPKHLDYSDDEEERDARRSNRNKDRPIDHIDLTKRPRTMSENQSSPNTSSIPHQMPRYQNRQPRQNRPQQQQQQQHNHYRQNQNNYNGNQQYQQRQYQQRPNDFQYTSAGNSSWHSNYQYGQQQPSHNYNTPQQGNFVLNPYAARQPYVQGNMMPFPTGPPPPPPSSQHDRRQNH